MDTITACWRQFERTVLATVKAGPVQVMETRRAFYAGISAAFGLHESLAVLSEAEGCRRIEGWRPELRQWVQDLKAGRV